MEEPKSKVINIAIMTVSDTRIEENDKSGKTLVDRLKAAGHHLADKKIVADEIDKIQIARWKSFGPRHIGGIKKNCPKNR